MSDNKNKPTGGADDLVAQLFNVGVEKPETPSEDVFEPDTRVDGEATLFDRPTLQAPDPFLQAFNQAASAQEVSESTVASTQLKSEKVSLNEFLGQSSVENVDSTQLQDKAVADFDFGKDIFDQALEDGTLPEDKISFFDTPKEEVVSPAAQAIATNTQKLVVPESISEHTIELTPAIEERIDEVLQPVQRSMASSRSDSSIQNLSPMTEAASTDFVEVAEIQMATPKRTRSWARLATGFMGVSIFFGLGVVGWMLTQEAGFLGYQLKGLSLQPAYQSLSADELIVQQKDIESLELAIQKDLPAQIESTLPAVEAWAQRDSRSAKAIQVLAEAYATLVFWYGNQSTWVPKLNATEQKATAFMPSAPDQALPDLSRSRAIRLLGIGDAASALKLVQSVNNPFAQVLAAEALIQIGQTKAAEPILSKQDSQAFSRAKVLGYQLNRDRNQIAALLEQKYPLAHLIELETRSTLPSLEEVNAALTQHAAYFRVVQRLNLIKAKVLLSKKSDLEAREVLATVTKADATNLEAWELLARNYQKHALWAESLDAYAAAMKAGVPRESLIESYARLLRLRAKVVDGLNVVESGLKTFVKSSSLWAEKGRMQVALFQEDSAKKSFEKAIELDAKNDSAILGLAEIAFQQKDLVKLEELIKKVSPQSVAYSESLLWAGVLASARFDQKRAEDFYWKALRSNPELEQAYVRLIALQLESENDSAAQSLIEQGIQVLPDSPWLALSKAKVLSAQSKYDDASKVLTEAMSKHDHLIDLSYEWINTQIEAKNMSLVWDRISQLQAKELRDAQFAFLKAKAFLADPEGGRQIGSFESAGRLAEQAVKREPNNPEYRVVAATLALRNQDRLTAFDHVDQILKHRPEYAPAHVVKGDIQMDNGENEKAARSYQEAMKFTKNRAPIYRKLAQSFRLSGQNKQALQYYQKVVESRPRDAEALIELGKLLNESGRFAAAVDMFKRAVAVQPNLAEGYYYLGFIYKEQAQPRLAVDNFRRFLQLQPSSAEASSIKDEIYFLERSDAR